LFGPAKIWVSATPFVGPAHVGRRSRDRYLRKAIRRELRRATVGGILPKEIAAAVRVVTIAPPPGYPHPLEFRRNRERHGDDGFRRPCTMVRLEFDRAVSGPICLGHASHFGLGLFLSEA